MSKFLKVFSLAIDIARIAEAAVPDGARGKAKLAFAVQSAAAIYDAEEEIRTSWRDKDRFLSAISNAVSSAVALLNAAGIFKKTAPAAR